MTAVNMEAKRALKMGLFNFSKGIIPLRRISEKRPPTENQWVRFMKVQILRGERERWS
jgi:hypothetical protein